VATPNLPNPRDVMTIKQAYSIGKSVESTANTAAIAAAKSIFGYKIILNSIPDTATSDNNLPT
tara:strand:+ start:158 stop:346 length:189 start_codon:yes stop_codon:yes gene_type:complete